MATEISLDLINQLKVSLRREAKLSSFDPDGDYTDSSFPSLPTAPEAIAELDASAPYLRCRNCKGKLLRGIESLICVFCGNQQRTSDNPPDPIKFTSTSAYKWFLSSLNLDGSEMVEPLKETNGSSRGAKAPVVKGIAVSKFLDLEVQWSARKETTLNNGQSVQNENRLNLGGISLDDYFVEGRGDLAKVDPAESKTEDDDFKDPRSLSLFDSVKSQGVAESQNNENVGLFNGKDVQTNVSSGEHENLSLFAGQDAQDSVSRAEQGNFGLFEEKDARYPFKEDENLSLFEGNDAQRTSSSKNDESFGIFEGKDAQRNSSSKEDESFGLFGGKDAQRNSASREDGNFGLFDGKDGQRNSSSKEDGNFGLFEGALSSNAGLKSSDDKVVASSSDWDSDFQSASQEKISGDPFVSSPVDLAAHMDSVFGSGKDLLYEKPADSSTGYVSKAGDWLQDDFFGNVTGKTQNNDPAVHDKNEGQVVDGNGSSSMDIDWIGDDLWQTSEKKAIEKTPADDNDDDDDWNDFAMSTSSMTPNNLLSRIMESSQEEIYDGLAHVKNDVKEQSKDEKQNTGTSVISDIAKGQEDDKVVASSSDWDSDFQSASQEKISGDPFVSSPVDLAAHMDSVFGSGKDLLYEKPADSSTGYVSKAGDWLQDDFFGNVTGKTQNNDPAVHDKNEGQVVGVNGNSSMDIDWIGDDLWQTSEKKAIEKTPADDNDDDDDWNDFAMSTSSMTPNNLLSRTMESSQEEIYDGLAHVKNDVKEQSKDEKQNTGTSVISDIAKGQEDDLFGTRDSFTSSTVLQTPVQPPKNNVNPSAELNPEMNLFGENNHRRELDSDFFSESIGGQTYSVEAKAMPSGTPTLERTSDPDGKDQTLDLVGTTTISRKS